MIDNKSKLSDKGNLKVKNHTKENTSNLNKIVKSKEYSEESKEYLSNLLNLPSDELEHLISPILDLSTSPYFYFFKERIYSIGINFLTSTNVSKADRVTTLKFLLDNYSSKHIFRDFLIIYDSMDKFKVNSMMFRNYSMLKVILKLFKMLEGSELSDFLSNNFYNIYKVEGFLDFVIRRIKDETISAIVLFYVYGWLIRINVDINKAKNIDKNDEDCNDKFISRIFQVYPLLYQKLVKYSGKSINNQSEEVEDSTENSKNLIETVKELYQSGSIGSIILSTYKRLFNFYLLKDKKKLNKAKILKCFKKEEEHAIYLKLKNYPNILINVFKQINKKYLIYEINRSKTKYLFENIGPIDAKYLSSFYKNYFIALEKDKEIKIIVENRSISTFAKEFNTLPLIMKKTLSGTLSYIFTDKIKLNLHNPDIVFMLVFLDSKFTDIVELVGLIVDNPSKLFEYDLVFYHSNVFKLILKHKSTLIANKGLMSRLDPIIRKLLNYKIYLPIIGEIFSSFYVVDGDFKTPQSFSKPLLYGAINHPQFKEVYDKEKANAFIEYDKCNPDGSTITSVDQYNKTVTKLSYDTEIGFLLNLKYCKIPNESELIRILKLFVPETNKLALEFINFYPQSLSFNFINNNLPIFYDILFYEPDYTTSILVDALKEKKVIPAAVVPYIMIFLDSTYLHRNYLDTCLNSLSTCVNIINVHIIKEISLISDDGELGEEGLITIVKQSTSNLFLYNLYVNTNIKAILKVLSIENDILSLYVILKNIRKMKKDDRDKVIDFLEENTTEEKLLDFISLCKLNYRRSKQELCPSIIAKYL